EQLPGLDHVLHQAGMLGTILPRLQPRRPAVQLAADLLLVGQEAFEQQRLGIRVRAELGAEPAEVVLPEAALHRQPQGVEVRQPRDLRGGAPPPPDQAEPLVHVAGPPRGCCCVSQRSVPSPHTRSTAWMPPTPRRGNRSARMARALRSFASLNVGTSTFSLA